jgi:hypothetical protein
MRCQIHKCISFFGILMYMGQPKKETTTYFGMERTRAKMAGETRPLTLSNWLPHVPSHLAMGVACPVNNHHSGSPRHDEMVQTIKKQQNRLASHRLKRNVWVWTKDMHHLLFSSGSTVNHMQIMQPKRKKKYVRKKGKTTNIKFNTQYGSQGNCKIKNQKLKIKNNNNKF